MTDADRVRATAPGAVRLSGGHPKIVCRRCGAAADADCATGHVHRPQSPSLAGFAIDEAQVTFWGLCPRCRPAGSRRG